jgi:hypothetical protein
VAFVIAGAMTADSGIGDWYSGPVSATWNDAESAKIARACWTATTGG